MLLDDPTLHASAVVANNAMNRERRLSSNARELGFDPLDHDDPDLPLADAHHGHPAAAHLKALADEMHDMVPEEWWAAQPQPLDNRVRN